MAIVFPAERALFPCAHKIGAAISGARIADKKFTDKRIFLNVMISKRMVDSRRWPPSEGSRFASLHGQNRAIVIAELLPRVVANTFLTHVSGQPKVAKSGLSWLKVAQRP